MANGASEPDTLTATSNPFGSAFSVAFHLASIDCFAYRYRRAAASDKYATAADLYTCTGDTDEPATSNCDPRTASQPGRVDGPLASHRAQPCGGGAG